MSSPVDIFQTMLGGIQAGKRLKQGDVAQQQKQQQIELEKQQEARVANQQQWENVQHAMMMGGKHVGPGDLIREDHPMPDLSVIGGTNEGMPSTVPVYRPVDTDQEFVATYPGAKGSAPVKIAIPNPDSQKSEKFQKAIADAQARVRNSQLAPNMTAQAQAETETAPVVAQGQAALRQAQLRTQGIPVPDDVADTIGYPRGTKVLPGEMISAREAADKIKKERLLTTRPGETVRDITKMQPGGGAPGAPGATPPGNDPSVVASGGPPLPTDDFGKYFLPARAQQLKKTVPDPNGPRKPTDMDPGEVTKAFQDFATSKKDPELLKMAVNLGQLHMDMLRQQMGNQPFEVKAGTSEDRVASQLAYGQLTFPDFNKLYSSRFNAAKKQGIYDAAMQKNPNFTPAGFEMGFKFASNPKIQGQLASLDNVIQAIPGLLDASDAASRTGVKKLNQYIRNVGIQFGGKSYSNINTARMAFGDELSGGLGFGGASDMKTKLGLDMTDPDLAPEAFKSTITDVVRPFVMRKRQTLLDQMGPYGLPGMNPGATRAQEQSAAQLPKGNGKVIDEATAKQYLEAAGGDKKKALKNAQDNGWK